MGVRSQLRPRREAPDPASTDGHGPPAGRRRRRPLLLAAAVVVAATAGAAWALASRGDGSDDDGATQIATATAEAATRDLAQTETFSGTLGFADPRTLAATAPGTITALAPEGAVRRRGDVLYRVDQHPVVLFIGALPAWRPLEEGVEGRDVLQLERNLEKLGYDPGTVDREFDADSEAAVESWQADLGLEETGTVALGDVVFSPGRARVGAHLASTGQRAQPGMDVLELTAATQVVTVELEVSDRDLVGEGDEVAVELPGGSTATGTVTEIGSVASEASVDPETGQEAAATVTVTIELPARASTSLDEAPVDVAVTTESKEGVLAVPVTALVALLGGGYAVEVSEGATTRLVQVEPGLYADGYVEIVAGDLTAGTTVVVPK